jgi:hypothetical protein
MSEIFRILGDSLLWPYYDFFLHFGKRCVFLNHILLLWIWREYVISKRCSNPEDRNFEQLLLWKPENWYAYLIIRTRNLRQVTLFLNLVLLFAEFRKSEACIFVGCAGEVLLCICLQNRSMQKKGRSILDLWLPVLCIFIKWIFEKKKACSLPCNTWIVCH